MKARVKAKKIDGCTACFEFEISQEEVMTMHEAICDEFSMVASIPGFRVGKAPRDLVKKVYKKETSDETIKRLILDTYSQAFEEHKISPVSLPEVTEVYFEEGKPLSFKITVDIKPAVTLKNYRGIRITKKKLEVKDEDVQNTLEKLQVTHAKYVAAEDRPIAFGDYAICDFECIIDGKPLNKTKEGFWIYVDKDSSVPSLGEKMLGMKKHEERRCEVAVPADYANKNLAGKAITYNVKLKEIKTRKVPQLDDEFAKDLGKDSLAALQADIRKALLAHFEDQIQKDMENQLINKLVDGNAFSVPSSFLTRQMRYLVKNAKEELLAKGLKKEDLDAKDEEFEKRFKDEALRRVRLYFILAELSRVEDLWCTDADLEDEFKAIAREDTQPIEEIRKYYESEGLAEDLKEQIREKKAIHFLMKEAVITEE